MRCLFVFVFAFLFAAGRCCDVSLVCSDCLCGCYGLSVLHWFVFFLLFSVCVCFMILCVICVLCVFVCASMRVFVHAFAVFLFGLWL